MNNTFKIIIYLIIGIVASILMIEYLEAFSNFGIAIILSGIAISIFYFIDVVLLKSIDTIEEIKKGNVAYGLLLLAYSIIVTGSIVASFSIFK